VLPTLTSLAQKLAVIGSATPSSIDALSRRVRALTAETEKMTAAKEAARAATPGGDGEREDDDEQAAKINALFGTLATIEGLAPLLPGVLERMRSLRKVHADAAGAAGEMEEALRRQEEMGREIEKWRVGLERVEEAVREGERVGGENVKTVEGWVRELEGRVKALDG
jgi:nuclear migration protein JNM1